MADVCITEYTDPGCPWAYSAEPFRRRLSWLYGDHLEWRVRLVGLAEGPDEYVDRGFTPERQSHAFAMIAREHGMPIDTSVRPRMAATVPACRAIVAARLNAPDRMRRLLRRLRVRHFSGELLDAPETIAGAARDAGIDAAELETWSASDEVEAALRDDMVTARHPIAAARVLDAKLANWSGGRRYTCPSYEIVRVSDGVKIAVPGFQPFAVYDVVTANLVPGVDRRTPPDVRRGGPRLDRHAAGHQGGGRGVRHRLRDARERLGRVADEQHVGADGFWSLNGSG